MTNFQQFADLALEGQTLNREQCLAVLNAPDDDILDLMAAAYRVRRTHCGNTVHIHMLTNAKSGLCPEDCHYCSQSAVSQAEIQKFPLLSTDKLLAEARRAKAANAKRYCMALSGRGPSDREIDALCETIRTIKGEVGISLCCSLGLLKPEQAARLKEAGLDRVNHNLNTSRRHHPNICTTHTYDDRLGTLRICREHGLEVCSGGILGQGETDDDIIDFLFDLREVNAESVPINFLVPMEGTPFERLTEELTPHRCLKLLALARFLMPDKEIRVAGGREYHLRWLQPMALYAANSIFVTGYLTTGGQAEPEAWKMIRDLGFEIEIEGDELSEEPMAPAVDKPQARIAQRQPVQTEA